tara:strand:+ start:31 stop:471 length:441 start_codon:yes stop_codon:yes gene_type:complete
MGRVFFNTRMHIQNITANHTALASDSNTVFIILPAATTDLTLPTPAVAGEGWNCKVILQSDSGFGGDTIMDQKVNIDLSADSNNVGNIFGSDGDTGVAAVDTNDFINCSAAASPGDTFDIICDGTRYFVNGFVFDASECVFGTATA